jgi:3-deoxy-D-manno-octulosonate 8-phosphate phosphatase (KDO 8-P phosphatase)
MAESIELLLLDHDGVMTDGTIGLDDRGREIKHYYSRDGLGIRLAQRNGIQVGVITGRGAPSVTLRLQELDIELVVQRSNGKADALAKLTERAGVAPQNTAFMGDDIIDLPAMRACGYPMAVADATVETQAAATYVTDAPGGRGAVREAVEHILKTQGKWEAAIAKYTE